MIKPIFRNFRLLPVAVMALAVAGCNMPDMRTADLAAKAGDYDTARYHYEKLAEFGVPEARRELAMMDINDQNNDANYRRGVELLEQGIAEEDDPEVFFDLGKAYQDGKRIKRNIPKAIDYYNRALALGYNRAYNQLGIISEDQMQFDRAESLYKKAYSTGYFKAAAKIGSLYKKGRGRPVDNVQALAWYYAAQSHNVPGLEKSIAGMELKLGADKSLEARELSKRLR